jgi:alkylated DNA repair dioxygenase AlkB
VSLGDARQFIFRDAADFSVRWHYRVRSGDVVEMFGDCQVGGAGGG